MNAIESIPYEILFEILEHLNMRDTIQTMKSLNIPDDDADYICARAHKRNFKHALDEIGAIEYEIYINVSPAVYQIGAKVSARSYRGFTTKYNDRDGLPYLAAISNKPWPVKMEPSDDYLPYGRRYYKPNDYVQEFENFDLKRFIIAREHAIGGVRQFQIDIHEYKIHKNI
jgi:hypothetical protein